jgi:hypothetical protein
MFTYQSGFEDVWRFAPKSDYLSEATSILHLFETQCSCFLLQHLYRNTQEICTEGTRYISYVYLMMLQVSKAVQHQG